MKSTLITIIICLYSCLSSAQQVELLHEVNHMTLPPQADCATCNENATLSEGLSCTPFTLAHGCVYKPKNINNPHELIIYIRGVFAGVHQVPPHLHQASIDQLKNTLRLPEIANQMGAPIYMTSSATSAFTSADLVRLAQLLGLATPIKVTIAAHSGGYKGMQQTLLNLTSMPEGFALKQILMLDNFYMDPDWINAFEQAVNNGASCRGYITDHNMARFTSRFKTKVPCQVEGPKGFNHEGDLRRCLVNFLAEKKCH